MHSSHFLCLFLCLLCTCLCKSDATISQPYIIHPIISYRRNSRQGCRKVSAMVSAAKSCMLNLNPFYAFDSSQKCIPTFNTSFFPPGKGHKYNINSCFATEINSGRCLLSSKVSCIYILQQFAKRKKICMYKFILY